jgi:galactitol-specific phosphotransferase system IIC component
MTKASPTPASFTVRLGHPVYIFFWSVWMVLLGCIIGMHLHSSFRAAVGISIACAAMIVIHELLDGFIWCTLAAWWIGRCQGQRERSIK